MSVAGFYLGARWQRRGLEQLTNLIGETIEFSPRGPSRRANQVRRQGTRREPEIDEQRQQRPKRLGEPARAGDIVNRRPIDRLVEPQQHCRVQYLAEAKPPEPGLGNSGRDVQQSMFEARNPETRAVDLDGARRANDLIRRDVQ